MLSKKIRLTTALFNQVFKVGKVQHSRSFWVRSATLPAGLPSRFAVAVPKKIASTAVLRNKIKRIVYRGVETIQSDILAKQPGIMVIFGVKSDISKINFNEVMEEIKSLLLLCSQKPALLSRSRGSTAVEKS